ncbi:MAG: protein serine/threonine phosphatase 2C family protein [Chloroflexi bacterium]|nr:protein serine/threonine phosphatase 2C family protein [Chloroflexota bacterium]
MSSTLVYGQGFSIGGGQIYEDRVVVKAVTLSDGTNIVVAIVADGYGGEGLGDRAAQVAVDSVVAYLEQAVYEDNLPLILYAAIEYAGDVVNRLAWDHRPAEIGTTLTIAAVTESNTLHVANIGNGRVYLHSLDHPELGLRQLTQDHTFAHTVLRDTKPSQRRLNQTFDETSGLIRVLGPRAEVHPDIGIYLDTDNSQVAEQTGILGVELLPGDSVLVTTDGLTRWSDSSRSTAVTDDEIKEVLATEEGDTAANMLVTMANARASDDNVSVAVLQVPDPRRVARKRVNRAIVFGAIAALVTVLVGILLFALQQQGRQVDAIAALATQQAEFSIFERTAIAETLAAVPTATASPSPTPRPPLLPNEVAALFVSGERSVVIEGQSVQAAFEDTYLAVNHTGELEDGHIFMLPPSGVQITNISNETASFFLTLGSRVFIETGRYLGGMIAVLDPLREVRFRSASCMSIDYLSEAFISAGCYSGTCEYSVDIGRTFQQIPVGSRVVINPETLDGTIEPIPIADTLFFNGILFQTGAGMAIQNECLVSYLPTPTPSPTPTQPVIATFTPVVTLSIDDSYGAFDSRLVPPFSDFRDPDSPSGSDVRMATLVVITLAGLGFLAVTLWLVISRMDLRSGKPAQVEGK